MEAISLFSRKPKLLNYTLIELGSEHNEDRRPVPTNKKYNWGKMKLYFITKHFQARRMAYDEKQNALWLDPNFKERFLKGRQVGFNLNLLRSIEQYPALSQKVSVNTPLVYFTLHLKDLKVAVGVDEEGLAFMNGLKVPDTPSISGNPIIQRALK